MVLTVDARYLKRPGVGISVYAADLIEELASEHDVCLLTSQASHAGALRLAYPGCEVMTLPARREVQWEQSLLPGYLRAAAPEMHVAPANKGLPARPVPSKLALVVHDLIPLRMPRTHFLPDPPGAVRYLAGTAVSLGRADLLVCNSFSTERDVHRLLPHRSTFVRYPRVPPLPVRGTGAPEGWPANYLIYTGGYGTRKNVDVLLDAHAVYLAQGGTVPLVLLGSGYPALHAQVERLGTGRMVTFAGHVDEETKWAALSAAHALVYPSNWEGFGLPILEGFAAGYRSLQAPVGRKRKSAAMRFCTPIRLA